MLAEDCLIWVGKENLMEVAWWLSLSGFDICIWVVCMPCAYVTQDWPADWVLKLGAEMLGDKTACVGCMQCQPPAWEWMLHAYSTCIRGEDICVCLNIVQGRAEALVFRYLPLWLNTLLIFFLSNWSISVETLWRKEEKGVKMCHCVQQMQRLFFRFY